MAMDDGEDVVIGLAKKARDSGSQDDEKAEDDEMSSGSYDKVMDSAADGIISAVNDGDKAALKEELMDFVRACVAAGKG